MEVTFKEGDPEDVRTEFRVVPEDALDTLAGTPIAAAMPEEEIKDLDYYAARKAAFLAAGNQLQEEIITQSVASVYQI